MTIPSNALQVVPAHLEKRELGEYGALRFRDLTFDAVYTLWQRRKSEGWTQKDVASVIGRDKGWVSRNLRGPGNWTSQIAGTLIEGLKGSAEVRVEAVEDLVFKKPNTDAYEGYRPNPQKIDSRVQPAQVVISFEPSPASDQSLKFFPFSTG